MAEKTIQESFVLPSKGKIYGDELVNPNFTLRSMTTADEMRRLAKTDTPYKAMADLIESCMVEKPGISVYDMCLGDYQYCLHKLRTVTYGPEYKMALQCPNCGSTVDMTTDLDSLEVLEYSDEVESLKYVDLPMSGKRVELSLQTPRMLDRIEAKVKEIERKRKVRDNSLTALVTLEALIVSVDGMQYNPVELEAFINGLPMKDTQTLIQASRTYNASIGLDTTLIATCPECGYEVLTTFRFTSEFFGPTL